jgi:hypothetical protein
MQPEPSHRTVKKRKRAPNERPPICFRPGDLRGELDARCDGTEAGYRATVVRDLERYYEMLAKYPLVFGPDIARALFEEKHEMPEHADPLWATVYRDAMERAHILVTHAGLTVDAALVAVGLVKEEEA